MNRIWELDEHKLLITILTGTVSLETVTEIRRVIVDLPGFTPTQDHLIDLSGVRDVAITPEQFRNIGTAAVHGTEARRAFVAPDALTFGLSRVLAGWSGQLRPLTESFRTRAEALAWLELPPDLLDTLPEPDATFPEAGP
jgi:hypothetical protein